MINCTFLAAVQELSCVHSLGGNKQLHSLFISVRITEHNLRQWSASTRVMNKILQQNDYLLIN